MDPGRRAVDSVLAHIEGALASTTQEANEVLTRLTRALSRIEPGTWVALVMNPDMATARVVVADDAQSEMANYVEKFIEAAKQPSGLPTFRLAQDVIESGQAIVQSSVPLDELMAMLSPAAKAYHGSNPPPSPVEAVDLVIVPMRVGGATVGTLALFDWHHRLAVGQADIGWLQAIADRAAIVFEYARLQVGLRTQVNRLELIGRIVLAAGYGRDLQLTARVIVELLTARLETDAADILIVDFEEGALRIAAEAGFHTHSAEKYLIPIAVDLADPSGTLVRFERLADADTTERNPRRSLFAREGFRSRVRIALRPRGKLVGVLEMFKRSIIDWDPEAVDFFETLGAVVSMSIDYAILTPARYSAESRGLARAQRPDLNDLELDIVRLIAQGLTNSEIAAHVHRSESTIKARVRRILERTNTSNRTDLAHRAAVEGWLDAGTKF